MDFRWFCGEDICKDWFDDEEEENSKHDCQNGAIQLFGFDIGDHGVEVGDGDGIDGVFELDEESW